jgi:putative aldouronate transport system substrate-binding protein
VLVCLLIPGLIVASCGAGAPAVSQGTGATAAAEGAAVVNGAETITPEQAAVTAPPAAAAGTAAPLPPVSVAGKLVLWSPGDNGTVKDWHQDAILKAVEEATGVQIEMVKVGWEHYTDQVNAAIASGKAPDIIGCIDHNNHQLIEQWVRDGVVAPFDGGSLEGKLQNVLKEFNKMPWKEELKVNGHIYYDPVNWETRPMWGNVIHVRKDLLDKYGMQPPNTFDQYFAFLKRAKQDGQTGALFNGSSSLGGVLDAFVGAYGVPPGGWVKKNGTWEYWATQNGTKNGLLLFRKMVADGLVDPSSWELSDTPRDKYVAGQGASMIWNGGGHTGRIQNDMTLAGKGAKEWALPALDAGAGSRGYAGAPSFYCGTFIGNMKGNKPDDAAKVLDYLQSEEGIKLTVLGIKGRDYEGEGNNIKLLPKRAEDGFPTEAGDTGSHPLATPIVSWIPQKWQDWQLLYGKDQGFKSWYEQMLDNQAKYLIPTQGTLSTSPAWTEAQSTLGELQNRAFLEIVKAKDEKAAAARFDQFVTEWKGAGGDPAAKEMNDVLNKIYK